MSEQNVDVEYVGRKQHAIDNVTFSGVAWTGPGDVQSVPLKNAETLASRHPDQWRIVTGEATAVEDPVAALKELAKPKKLTKAQQKAADALASLNKAAPDAGEVVEPVVEAGAGETIDEGFED